MKYPSQWIKAGVFLAALLVASCATYTSLYFTDRGGLSLEGYDPVAYFLDGEPVVGDPQYRFKWMGTTWQFKSEEHLELFEADPVKFAPQYGGYCAWAAARSNLAEVDPEVWAIVDDKLYLNRNKGIQKDWEANMDEYINLADNYWPNLRAGLQP